MTTDFKDTVFLPRTDFSMQRPLDEAGIVESWKGLYSLTASDNGNAFVLHDGPPYANGDIHIGHAMNKVLKDFVVRSQLGMGKEVNYRPGWDCHGLPIEQQVEKHLLQAGVNKSDMPLLSFRAMCREYATQQLAGQMEGFKALGVLADYDRRYATMDFLSEAKIARELHKLHDKGLVYRGTKPFLWSTVEQTALADAEVDHLDMKTTEIWVKYKFKNLFLKDEPVHLMIWTTTPWTIPASRAVAFSPDINYHLYQEGFTGDYVVVSKTYADRINAEAAKGSPVAMIDLGPYNNHITGAVLIHPLWPQNDYYSMPIPLLEGSHVRDETGTGFVHTAPGHGPEDYALWQTHNMGDVPEVVDAAGSYLPEVGLFGSLNVLTKFNNKGVDLYTFEPTNKKVMDALNAAGALAGFNTMVHSYPHSWRSKAPLIFRNTTQWFVRVDSDMKENMANGLTYVAMAPERSRNRLETALATRPDWLISRQRVWGTPLALFVHEPTGRTYMSPALQKRIFDVLSVEGGDAWWQYSTEYWLEDEPVDPSQYQKVTDVLDVWFDSSCSLELIDKAHVDLYLEGSDQHRGWFGTSILRTVAATGRMPFKNVLTHGFTLDDKGRKMSKSVGNVISPQEIVEKHGTDVLRLWVAMSDYTVDVRCGPKMLDTTMDVYKKFRLTLRYLMGALDGFTPVESVSPSLYPELEGFIHERLGQLSGQITELYQSYEFGDIVRILNEFCINDLSAFFFDIRKDVLYCDDPKSVGRRAYRTVLNSIFTALTAWLQPIMPFMVHEVMVQMRADVGILIMPKDHNIHRHYEPQSDPTMRELDELCDQLPKDNQYLPDREGVFRRWRAIRKVASLVNQQLEEARAAKTIKTGYDTKVALILPIPLYNAFSGVELDAAEILRVSQVTMLMDLQNGYPVITIHPADGQRCERSRRYFTDVGADPDFPTLSLRDARAVKAWEVATGKREPPLSARYTDGGYYWATSPRVSEPEIVLFTDDVTGGRFKTFDGKFGSLAFTILEGPLKR
jgi:isoleucyl-tRNA synthetase